MVTIYNRLWAAAYKVMVYIVMAYTCMACIVMAYISGDSLQRLGLWAGGQVLVRLETKPQAMMFRLSIRSSERFISIFRWDHNY